MPRLKRGGDLASSAAKRRKQKEYRRNETEEEREARLQNQRIRMSTLRSKKSEERNKNKSYIAINHKSHNFFRSKYICIDHFHKKYIRENGMKIRLRKFAIPEPYTMNTEVKDHTAPSPPDPSHLVVKTTIKVYQNRKRLCKEETRFTVVSPKKRKLHQNKDNNTSKGSATEESGGLDLGGTEDKMSPEERLSLEDRMSPIDRLTPEDKMSSEYRLSSEDNQSSESDDNTPPEVKLEGDTEDTVVIKRERDLEDPSLTEQEIPDLHHVEVKKEPKLTETEEYRRLSSKDKLQYEDTLDSSRSLEENYGTVKKGSISEKIRQAVEATESEEIYTSTEWDMDETEERYRLFSEDPLPYQDPISFDWVDNVPLESLWPPEAIDATEDADTSTNIEVKEEPQVPNIELEEEDIFSPVDTFQYQDHNSSDSHTTVKNEVDNTRLKEAEQSSSVLAISGEVIPVKRRRSIIGVNNNNNTFIDTGDSFILDSDCDLNDNDLHPTETTIQIDTETDEDLTPHQLKILHSEDTANNRALHDLVPKDCLNFNWTGENTTFTSHRETFTGNPGPTFDVTDSTTPTDIFHRMFDVEFIDTLCTETNRYAQQKLGSEKEKLTPTSRFRRWTPTDRQEMICFLSIFILQGLYPLPNEKAYFSFNGFCTMPYFCKIMTYNRYILLKSLLHFNNNDLLTKTTLFKIQPIIDYFNRQFSSLYYPQQEIVIEESLKGDGRLSFAQKININSGVGVKTYELCESSTGYLWQFRVYAGKDNTRVTNNRDDNDDDCNTTKQNTRTVQTSTTDLTPTNATAMIVLDLIEPLLHRGHTLIMDDCYNCPLLARCLKRKQTDCFGTQRLNREFIPASMRTLTNTDIRYGELVATYCSDLSLMVWRDAKLVSMISTYHSLQNRKRNKNNRTTNKPSIVLDYNKSMGGVERKEQFLAAQPIEWVNGRRNTWLYRVWYKQLFRRLFNIAVFNCYVIHHTKHTKLSHRQFRTILAEDLLKTYRHIDLTTETRVITRPCGVRSTTSTITTTTSETTTKRNTKLTMQNRPIVKGDHFPMRAAANRGNCWWCSQKKLLSRTVWKCIECGVYLCIIGCFRDFHKP